MDFRATDIFVHNEFCDPILMGGILDPRRTVAAMPIGLGCAGFDWMTAFAGLDLRRWENGCVGWQTGGVLPAIPFIVVA